MCCYDETHTIKASNAIVQCDGIPGSFLSVLCRAEELCMGHRLMRGVNCASEGRKTPHQDVLLAALTLFNAKLRGISPRTEYHFYVHLNQKKKKKNEWDNISVIKPPFSPPKTPTSSMYQFYEQRTEHFK
ncbi:hypothetical protein POVCU2_0044190 [Plasmodium ovale curtisi]|uniref:Uncharacterized protein n=1 Tax=Plasmodium ovale curtisi TaxID=864141 RepID=A0A1A8W482_PLAOA|nr:hypothetical protein POVCU2_0044190 [Plasmodium ovale curtisi]SBS97771.1 hypothetical protein POVCU1_040840 [Plasmodium ovale curtisi]